jgi:hypothetical protein
MNYFEKNLDVLKKHHPQLADVILSDRIEAGRVRVMASESGEARVIFTRSDGEEVRIHSTEDPVKCAQDALDLLNKTEKEGVIVLLGFGLGYLAQELLRHFETGHTMLIYEATPALFRAALGARDLSDFLSSNKIKILVGPDVDDFSFLHTYHHHLMNGSFYIVGHMPSMKLNQGAYDRFRKRAKEEKRLIVSGVGTAVGLGKEFVNAFLQNLPNILRAPGVKQLCNLFEGRPAIVVAAGPSLEKNLHLLKKATSKAVIVAVDAAIPTLLPAGIIPDVLVAIDPLPENIAFFRDNPLLKDVPFICLTQYTPEIVNIYPGPLFMNTVLENPVTVWLSPFWEEKGSVTSFGGSVAHIAFAVAEYLGCSTIALVGLDLSYGTKFHAGDASQLLTDTHGVPFEFGERASTASDIFGETRQTLSSFLTFKTSFENRFRTFKGRVAQATEGGLPLDGAMIMRLSDFIDEYCDVRPLDARFEMARLFSTDVTYNLDGLTRHVKTARQRFIQTRKLSSRMITYINRLQKLREKQQDDSPEFHAILGKVERITEEVRTPFLNLIAVYHYQLELYLKRQSVLEIDDMKDKYERLDKQLVRGLNYYGELIEAIDLFVKQLDHLLVTLKRDEKINKVLTDGTIPEPERFYRAALMFKRGGRASLAVRYLEAAEQRLRDQGVAGQVSQIDFMLAELYISQFRPYEARELLEKGRIQGPGSRVQNGRHGQVEALLNRCDEKIRLWEDRQARMEEIVRKAETHYGGNLESGLFYYRVTDYNRAASAYQRAIDEYLSGPHQRVAACYGLAHTFLKLRENQRAIDAFACALEIDPANVLIHRDLALLAMEHGNYESAERFLTKALELAPRSEELYRLQKELALLYQELITQQKGA